MTVAEILDRIRELELALEQELTTQHKTWHYRIEAHKVRFERQARQVHRTLRQSVTQFIRQGSVLSLITAPVIYSLIVPLVMLDLWLAVYQSVCFPVYGIPRVPRSRYIVIDRHHLSYLNGIEKLNCIYCGYANGLLAYVREVAGLTEQYWCPIKHARRVRSPHAQYAAFVDFGDAEGYHARRPALRQALRTKHPAGGRRAR